jgi:hypothetical protein
MRTLVTERRNGGWLAEYVGRECTAYWAERYIGRGDARVHYFARVAGGDVVGFLKKMNRSAKLLAVPDLEWLPPVPDEHHRHGPYGAYYGTIQRSKEIAL